MENKLTEIIAKVATLTIDYPHTDSFYYELVSVENELVKLRNSISCQK